MERERERDMGGGKGETKETRIVSKRKAVDKKDSKKGERIQRAMTILMASTKQEGVQRPQKDASKVIPFMRWK